MTGIFEGLSEYKGPIFFFFILLGSAFGLTVTAFVLQFLNVIH